jgi:hypothetical protein
MMTAEDRIKNLENNLADWKREWKQEHLRANRLEVEVKELKGRLVDGRMELMRKNPIDTEGKHA